MNHYILSFVSLFAFIFLHASSIRSEIYEWVDEDGKIHCTNVHHVAHAEPNEPKKAAEDMPDCAKTSLIPSQSLRSETAIDLRDLHKNDIAQLSELMTQLQNKLRDLQYLTNDGKNVNNLAVNIPPTAEFELIKQAEKDRSPGQRTCKDPAVARNNIDSESR